jgi:hypothetical protein
MKAIAIASFRLGELIRLLRRRSQEMLSFESPQRRRALRDRLVDILETMDPEEIFVSSFRRSSSG